MKWHVDMLADDADTQDYVERMARVRGDTERQYHALVSGFEKLSVHARDTYPKHYPHPKATDLEVAEDARRKGCGVLFPRTTPEWQLELAWYVLGDYFRREVATLEENDPSLFPMFDFSTLDNPRTYLELFQQRFTRSALKLVADLGFEIGATASGRPARHALLDFDLSSGRVHVWPCEEDAIRDSSKIVFVSRSGFVRP